MLSAKYLTKLLKFKIQRKKVCEISGSKIEGSSVSYVLQFSKLQRVKKTAQHNQLHSFQNYAILASSSHRIIEARLDSLILREIHQTEKSIFLGEPVKHLSLAQLRSGTAEKIRFFLILFEFF